METINHLRTQFNKGVKEFLESNIDLSKKVYGVSIVPLHIYSGDNEYLLGKPCIVLGKERDGIYTNQFNFFGGKVEESKNECESKLECISTTIFDEALEEMGYILTPEKFEKSVVKIISNEFNKGISVIFICHINGISRFKWSEIISDRFKNSELEWRYQEMSEIEHVPIEDIQTRKDTSLYVKQNMYKILDCVKLLNRCNIVYIGNFKNTKGLKF